MSLEVDDAHMLNGKRGSSQTSERKENDLESDKQEKQVDISWDMTTTWLL